MNDGKNNLFFYLKQSAKIIKRKEIAKRTFRTKKELMILVK
jgi:hypothetical protein